MKQILYFSFLIVLSFSCKKQNNETITPTNTVKVYENLPNTTDAMIASVYQSEYQSTVHFYGSFNSNGVPNTIKAFKAKRNNSDTINSYILDDSKRIKLVYSELNGQKLEKVIKLNYLSNNKVSVNVYNYNWINNTSILIKQYLSDFNSNTLTSTYGRTMNNNEIEEVNNVLGLSKNEMIKFYNFGLAVAAVAANIGACAGPQGMTPICPWATGFIWLSVGLLTREIAKGDELKGFSPNTPSSPTNGQIPNPIGTPTYPNGLQIGDAYEGGLIFYFSDSAHQHGRVCATEDVGNYPWDLTIFDPQNPYSYNPPYLGGTSTSVVSGVSNTTRIIATLGSGNYAAYMCRSYRGNGYNDWSLPSKDELNLIYQNLKLKGLGSFGRWYQSSSEIDNKFIWSLWFENGTLTGGSTKNNAFNVRATRGF